MNDIPKILIVDDERFHLNVMIDLLGDDYKVLVAKNGERALELAASEPQPDLILLDVLMPEMDGYEVCRRLKQDEKTRHVPVIFLTVKSDVADETYGFDLGAADYITKPFSPPIVKARVGTQLALGRALWELEQQNERLEQRVRERTQEIVRSQEERERLQLRLQRVQKMESIGLLAGGIVHDFNNILNAVWGFADIALLELKVGNHREAAECIADINIACERATGLVQQLLAFSRGVPGKPQPLQPADSVRTSIKLLRPVMSSLIRLDASLDDAVPAILFDKVQMHQVVMNLCINARDAMNNQGNLSVSIQYLSGVAAECSACHDRISGDFVVLEVKDSGSGISAEQIENIFEPFFSTKKVGKGTGMGLSVVNEIMHKHQGHIVVETEMGKGTVIRLLFPPAREVEMQQAEDDASAMQVVVAEKHILLVDDDISVAMLLKELLESSGYRVTIHNDSLKALAALKAQPKSFDLVIADQSLPDMTGTELAASIVGENIKLPVIVCTEEAFPPPEASLARGVATILSKPLHSGKLVQEIQRQLSDAAEPAKRTG